MSQSPSMFQSMPEEVLCCIAVHLHPEDLLQWLCSHRSFLALERSWKFWNNLIDRLEDDDNNNESIDRKRLARSMDHLGLKHLFLALFQASDLTQVRWHQTITEEHRQGSKKTENNGRTSPSAREGHGMCCLHHADGTQTVVTTGGFCGDPYPIYLMPLDGHSSPKWRMVKLAGSRPTFAYGCTLTAIDEIRAVRFGGFRRGSYRNETNEVWLLRVYRHQYSSSSNPHYAASWSRQRTYGAQPRARAYTSATLIKDRYILYFGGMASGTCNLDIDILDTLTWTWLAFPEPINSNSPQPSDRHGHSLIYDSSRNRFVLFGGGSCGKMFRSGEDNSDVWEFKMIGEVTRKKKAMDQKQQHDSDFINMLSSQWVWTRCDASRFRSGASPTSNAQGKALSFPLTNGKTLPRTMSYCSQGVKRRGSICLWIAQPFDK